MLFIVSVPFSIEHLTALIALARVLDLVVLNTFILYSSFSDLHF